MSGALESLRAGIEEFSATMSGPEKVIAGMTAACFGTAGLVFAGPALADVGSAVATVLSLDAKTIVSAGLGAGAVVAGAWKALAGRAERTAQKAATHAERSDERAARIEADFGVGDPDTPPIRLQLAEIRSGIKGIEARHELLEQKVEAQGSATLRAYGEISTALSVLSCDPLNRRPADSAASKALRSAHSARPKRSATSRRRAKRGNR